jgi:hemerythrin-like domain-containing protein
MSDPNSSLSEYFVGEHRGCDGLWAEVESAVEAGAAESIAAAWRRFDQDLRRHLAMEEEILFPAFEAATGMTQGQMQAAADSGDHQELLDQGDTLHLLIQQHNQKEEHMLYPMSERALAPDWPELREKLDAFSQRSRES